MKTKFSDKDIHDRRSEYKRALKDETQASITVRDAWRKMVAMFDELLAFRKDALALPEAQPTPPLTPMEGFDIDGDELVADRAQPTPPDESLYSNGMKFLRASLEECAKGKTVTFTADHLETLVAVFEGWAQPTPGWTFVDATKHPHGMPPQYDEVLFSTTYEQVEKGKWNGSESERNKRWQSCEVDSQNDPIFFCDDEVIAWQPLPSPPEPTPKEQK